MSSLRCLLDSLFWQGFKPALFFENSLTFGENVCHKGELNDIPSDVETRERLFVSGYCGREGSLHMIHHASSARRSVRRRSMVMRLVLELTHEKQVYPRKVKTQLKSPRWQIMNTH